jgi:tRNA (mo5U34)-methyltransferase
MEKNILIKKIENIHWHHTFNFDNGINTLGGDNSKEKLNRLHLPDDLTGQTVLDIGAWDGFFSFEAEKRGAKKVLATDFFCWSGPGIGTKDGFNLAKEILNSKIEDMEIDITEICPEKVGVFDLVLFLGVLYHLKNPLHILEKVASVTKNQLILETHIDMACYKKPLIAFYPNNELNNDDTNWCGPNISAIEGMLKTVGFTKTKVVWKPSFIHRLCSAIKQKIKNKNISILTTMNQGRIIIHAWK